MRRSTVAASLLAIVLTAGVANAREVSGPAAEGPSRLIKIIRQVLKLVIPATNGDLLVGPKP